MENRIEILESDLSSYGNLPDDIWGWYQLRIKYPDGGRPNIAQSTTVHLPTLLRYAKKCDHITEFGVRYVVSTWALLAGYPNRMISVDCKLCPVSEVYEATEKAGINYEFLCANDLDIEIEPTDLLFIDSLHTYEHLTAELKAHAEKVNKYIILHDTIIPQMARAVTEFLYKNKEWSIVEVTPESYGLTVLSRADYERR